MGETRVAIKNPTQTIKRGFTVKLLKRIVLTKLTMLVLITPALSLAESDYETGDG